MRPPAVAGSFYPRESAQLEHLVASLLDGASAAQPDQIRAVIAPHAGYPYSGAVAAEAFAGLGALRDRIERVVVIGPAHFVPVRGVVAPSHSAFQTPLGEMPVDRTAIKEISALARVASNDVPHASEHALEVELPFLQAVLGPVPIVPLVVGSARAEHVAEVLNHMWDDQTLIVVSSDLSHFHDHETARRLDTTTAEAIERMDEAAIGPDDACGALAIRAMLIEAQRRGFSVERLDLRNSGDAGGGRERVVGYGAWAVHEA